MVVNEPKKYIGEYEVDSVRGAYENRGRWYYYLVKEGLDQGLPLDFARDAMREAGRFQYETRFKDVNEGEVVRKTDDELEIDLGYCPLVAAWQKLTDDEAFMSNICDVCMDMDRGLAESMGWEMELKNTIASGCGKCTMCFKKK